MSLRHSRSASVVQGLRARLRRAEGRSSATGCFAPAPVRRVPRRNDDAAAHCEALESRRLLTSFAVTNLADSGGGSLRQAILDANANPGADAVVFADGLAGAIPLTTGQLSITDPLTIDGPGAGRLAVSGSQLSRVFRISGGTVVSIADLTITQGRAVGAPAEGGGILNVSSTLTLNGVSLSNNQAVGGAAGADGRGGAVANIGGGTLTVVDCLFTGNQALGGARGRGNAAGILNLSSTLTVHRSTFAGNQAMGGVNGGPALGGGISTTQRGATATITDSTFIGNQSIAGSGAGGIGTGRGGGVYSIRGTTTIQNCAFIENVARGGSNATGNAPVIGCGMGGGVFSGDAATLLLTGSVIRGNQAVGGDGNTATAGNGFVGAAFGGGMNNVSAATVVDCLFEHNQARGGAGNRGGGASTQFAGTGNGGGIHASAGDPSGTPVTLNAQNVTVRFNLAIGGSGNTGGTFVDAGVGGGMANYAANINVSVSSGSAVTLSDSIIDHNHAIGGGGGDGLGGGISNVLGGVFNIAGSTVSRNHAQGGDAVAAGSGGDGLGGGIYNGAASTHSSNLGAATILRVEASSITENKAQGGVAADGISAGVGVGGGVYTLGQFDLDAFTVFLKNKATTSDDDIYGVIT